VDEGVEFGWAIPAVADPVPALADPVPALGDPVPGIGGVDIGKSTKEST
jgi:hypothetical protein